MQRQVIVRLALISLMVAPAPLRAQGLPPPPSDSGQTVIVPAAPQPAPQPMPVEPQLEPRPVAPAQQPLTVTQPTENDLAALRYFISQNDDLAIAAEQERLSRRFPDADIDLLTQRLRTNETADTTVAWELIDQDRYDEARVEIDRIRNAVPGWEPEAEMIRVLREKEGQAILEAALIRRDLNAAVQAAQNYPELVTCERVNTPWRLAELMTEYREIQAALDTYVGTALTCTDIDIIVASLQKGHAIADDVDWTRAAFAAAQQEHPEHYDRLQFELEELLGRPEDNVPAPVVVTQLDLARNATNKRDYNECLRLLQGRSAPAEELARGWCLHNLGQASAAQTAFNSAAARGSGSVKREARFGLTLSYFSSGAFVQGKALRDTTRFTKKEQDIVERVYLGAAAQYSFERRRYRDTLAYLDNLTLKGVPLTRGQLMVQGWALARLGRRADAQQVFGIVQATAPGKDVDDALRSLRQVGNDR